MDHRGPHLLRDGVQVHDGKGVPERLHAGRLLLGLDHGYDTDALVDFSSPNSQGLLKACWGQKKIYYEIILQAFGLFARRKVHNIEMTWDFADYLEMIVEPDR